MTHDIRWLTIREAADRACCRPARIQQAVRTGHLRAVRIGTRGELKLRENWLDDWLAGQLLPQDTDIAVAINASASRHFSL
jgi:excisionase family DNA binding protein